MVQRVQLSFVPDLVPAEEPTFMTDDDYETPDPICNMLADQCLPSDRVIIDAGAGCGNITQRLAWQDAQVIPVEANPKRCAIGQGRLPYLRWLCKDFLEVMPIDLNSNRADGLVDLVIGNPPFSLLVAFINHSFEVLLQPKGRIILLLPGDIFHEPTVLDAIKTPFTLQERKIIGRIAYLKDGAPERGRQVYDSIFILKRAKRKDSSLLRKSDYVIPF